MSVEKLIISALVFIASVLAIVFLIPAGTKRKKAKKKKAPNEPQEDHSACEQKQKRLEQHIHSLKEEVVNLQKADSDRQKELMVERVKIKKFQEKLNQEREWHEKEQAGIDKRSREFRGLKDELVSVQEQFSREHSANLRHEKKIKDLEKEIAELNERRRDNENEILRLNAQTRDDKQEIAELRRENIQLAKKKDDASWVAKSEYDRVAQSLKEKEKELDRLRRETSK